MNESVKHLTRSRSDAMVGGVLAGLAHYFTVDPTVVRVLFLLAIVLTGGTAVLAYPMMWLIMPADI